LGVDIVAMLLLAIGWLGVVGGAVTIAGALLPSLPFIGSPGGLGIGLVALLNGALVLAVASMARSLQQLNAQVEPLYRVGAALAPRYGAGGDAAAPASAADNSAALDAIVLNPPENAQVYANGSFRVVLMSDGKVIAQTAEGTRSFDNLDAYRKFAGLG
jgi:hypothetical protein